MHPLKPDEQSKKWIGRFSVKERQDVYGHLFFVADEGIRTELFYDTKEERTPHISLNGMIDCISGVTEGSDKVTLIDCFEGGSIQRRGLNKFNLHVNYLLWGQHITDLNEPLFKLFSFSSQSFHAFISPENIRVHHDHKNDRLSVKYVKPKNKIYECKNLGTLVSFLKIGTRLSAG